MNAASGARRGGPLMNQGRVACQRGWPETAITVISAIASMAIPMPSFEVIGSVSAARASA